MKGNKECTTDNRRGQISMRNRRTPEDQLADQIVDQILNTPRGRRMLGWGSIAAMLIGGSIWVCHRFPRHHFPVGPTVRLATWNLGECFEDRESIALATIARVIHDNHFDLIAIAKANRDGLELDRLISDLGTSWRVAEFKGIPGHYERFAFIYNADRIQQIGTPHLITTPSASIFDSTPYQDTFRAGDFAFTLIEANVTCNDLKRRNEQMQALANYAAATAAASTTDTIVSGSFNEASEHSNPHYFLDVGWKNLNTEPTNRNSTNVFGTFLIDPRQTTEWNGVAASAHVDKNDNQAVKDVSEHPPVYADFVTATAGVTPAPMR